MIRFYEEQKIFELIKQLKDLSGSMKMQNEAIFALRRSLQGLKKKVAQTAIRNFKKSKMKTLNCKYSYKTIK